MVFQSGDQAQAGLREVRRYAFPSAAVRTITPRFFGLIASMILWSRFRSSDEWIYGKTAMMSLNGVTTTNRPGKESSQLRRAFGSDGFLEYLYKNVGPAIEYFGDLPIYDLGSTLNFEKIESVGRFIVDGPLVNLRIDRT